MWYLGIFQAVVPVKHLGIFQVVVRHLGIFQVVVRHLGIFQVVVRHLGIFQVVVRYLGIFQVVVRYLGIFQVVVLHLGIFDLRSAQVYCVAIFLVSQEVSLNFHRCCGKKLWVGWVGRGYTEISRYFPASWINWVTLVTKIKLLYSLRF